MISLDSGVYTLPSPTNYNSEALPSQAGKRMFDLAVTFLALLLVLVWAVPLLALAIRLTSQGPVFLVQLRTGRQGRPFRYIKFRTTSCKPEAGLSTSYQSAQVTALGRFLRTTHQDQLPLFFTVLTGDMSIVGPRPHTLQFDAQHWTIPGYRDRYRMRPGILCLSQLRTRRPHSDQIKNEIRYDRWYMNRYSLSLDSKICWWRLTGR
ncbi:sugar transferase [Larkinella arboricola]